MPDQYSFSQLHQQIVETYNREDLRGLCFQLNLRYEDLLGETLSTETQSLIELMQRLDRLPDLLIQLKSDRPSADWAKFLPSEPEAKPPFKGLNYFTEKDEKIFFGRNMLTNELIDHLNEHRFLAIVGASGSGKSSIVRAGVIPPLRRGDVETNGQDSWQIYLITPGEAPLKALAAALTQNSESVTAMKTLLTDMRNDIESLDLWLYRELLIQDTRVLLVIDQFEELFTQCQDIAERKLFIDNLISALNSSKSGHLSIIITLRADFYNQAVQYEKLRPLLETRQKIVGAMSSAELRRAIEGPIENEDWHFQTGLIESILDDLGAGEKQKPEPGALPLLSHALLQTWQRREGRTMTLAGYTGAGGVRKAIAKTADRVYGKMTSSEKSITHNIFFQLTELGEDAADTRRRTSLEQLNRLSEDPDEVKRVLVKLANSRLIMINETSVEVAHEALIREWSQLKGWIDKNREILQLHRKLTQATKEWEENGYENSFLYTGARLATLEETLNSNFDSSVNLRTLITSQEEVFITKSKDFRKSMIDEKKEREQKDKINSRFRTFLFLIVLIISSVAAFYYLRTHWTNRCLPNCSTQQLTQQDLNKVNMSNVFLRFNNIDFSNAILHDLDLSGANLKDANFQGAILTNTILSSANLNSADLTNANLENANLSQAELRNAKLSNTIFHNTNLSYVDLQRMTLHGLDLSGAIMRNTNLNNADLSNANLSGADLENASLRFTNLTDANLENAILTGADLEGTNFKSANLID